MPLVATKSVPDALFALRSKYRIPKTNEILINLTYFLNLLQHQNDDSEQAKEDTDSTSEKIKSPAPTSRRRNKGEKSLRKRAQGEKYRTSREVHIDDSRQQQRYSISSGMVGDVPEWDVNKCEGKKERFSGDAYGSPGKKRGGVSDASLEDTTSGTGETRKFLKWLESNAETDLRHIYTYLNSSREVILRGCFDIVPRGRHPPPKTIRESSRMDRSKYCLFHNGHGHIIDECYQLWEETRKW